jgi:hypothetical protein
MYARGFPVRTMQPENDLVNGDRFSFVTRMFLRDYAFIERLHGKLHHSVNYNFAALATTAWFTVLTILLLLFLCVLFRDVIPAFINPLTAEKGILLIECLTIPFIVDFLVERSIQRYKSAGRPDAVDRFSVPIERIKWWATTLSILAMTAAVAMLLARNASSN